LADLADRFWGEDRAAVGPEISQLLNDPTLKLNDREYAIIQQKVTALPGGADILARAEDAQGEGVVIAVRHIFWGAFGAAIVCTICALLMKELPLRKTVTGGSPGGASAAQEGAGPGMAAEPLPGVVGH
jgi:hypothetical protein